MLNQDLLFNNKKKTLLKKAKIEKKREKKNIVTMNFLLNCNQHLNKEKKIAASIPFIFFYWMYYFR